MFAVRDETIVDSWLTLPPGDERVRTGNVLQVVAPCPTCNGTLTEMRGGYPFDCGTCHRPGMQRITSTGWVVDRYVCVTAHPILDPWDYDDTDPLPHVLAFSEPHDGHLIWVRLKTGVFVNPELPDAVPGGVAVHCADAPIADGNLAALDRPCLAYDDFGVLHLFRSWPGGGDDVPLPIAPIGTSVSAPPDRSTIWKAAP